MGLESTRMMKYCCRSSYVVSSLLRDECGRRHLRPPGDRQNQDGPSSLVDQAIEAIRRAAVNTSAYKLNLKQAFLDFDTSGDGFLSCEEMVHNVMLCHVRSCHVMSCHVRTLV